MGGWVLSEDAFIKTVEPLLKNNEYKKALKLAEKEAKKNPDNPFAWYAKGQSLLKMSKYSKAIEAFSSFVQNKRANLTWGWFYLGECYKGLKDYSQAIIHYKKSLELNPKYRQALFSLEFCCRQLNDVDNAIKVNEEINKHYPRDEHSWYWLSILHFQRREIQKAFSYIHKSIQQKPKDQEVKAFYNLLQQELKGISKSKQGLNALLEIELSELGYGRLDMRGVGLTSIEQVEDLEYTGLILHHIYLNDNAIETITSFSNYPQLMTLLLNDNRISKISSLGYLPKLMRLNLAGNEITVIEKLDDLPKLQFLLLDDNQIKKIEGLEKLSSLVSLQLKNNLIETITGLENTPSIKWLYLANNQISKIEGLEKLRNLKTLDLSNNPIQNYDGLQKIAFIIEDLRLTDNQISTMKIFSKMYKLTKLDLSNNNLSTIDNLEEFPKLQHLNLEDNPKLPEYFAKIYSDKTSIEFVRRHSGLSFEELKTKSDKILEQIEKTREQKEIRERERKEKEALARKKDIEKETYFGSNITSSYGSKNKIYDRVQALLKLDEHGICLYCREKITNDDNYTRVCSIAINRMITDSRIALPGLAKDRNSYTERTYTEQVTNRRMDIYDRPGYSTVTRTVKNYHKTKVGRFEDSHFPKLQVSVCKKCSNEFIKKASRIFKPLQRRGFKDKQFVDKIQQSMKKCHENYMKLYESFLEKRGV